MYISPEVPKKNAEHILSQRKSFFSLKIRKKPFSLEKIELFYLPFYVFEIVCERGAEKQKMRISLDGLFGSSLFFIREGLRYKSKIDHLVSPFVLSLTDAKKKALEEFRWLLLEQGLRNKKSLSGSKITGTEKIYYPFWVGYFQKRKAYDFRALDGVSGEIAGVKMRRIFLKAFKEASDIDEEAS